GVPGGPGRLVRSRRLPEREIGRVALPREILVDALARPDELLLDAPPGERAVSRERPHFVEDLAAGDVRVPLRNELRHHLLLLFDEVGGARVRRVILDVKEAAVAPER